MLISTASESNIICINHWIGLNGEYAVLRSLEKGIRSVRENREMFDGRGGSTGRRIRPIGTSTQQQREHL